MPGGSCCVGLWSLTIGHVAHRLERLIADQQVPGSNPGVPFLRAPRAGEKSRIAGVLRFFGVGGCGGLWPAAPLRLISHLPLL